jgi:hypothetical protein
MNKGSNQVNDIRSKINEFNQILANFEELKLAVDGDSTDSNSSPSSTNKVLNNLYWNFILIFKYIWLIVSYFNQQIEGFLCMAWEIQT